MRLQQNSLIKFTMIQIKNVSKSFDDIAVIEKLSLHIQAGNFVSLLGPSGCGKTTILRLIADLIEPTSGKIHIASERLSIVFQKPTLLQWRTVQQNIVLPLELEHTPKESAVVEQLIELVGLTGYENLYPYQLSGGMAQRVAVARALITQPTLLLMDEPFSGLDEITRNRLGQDLRDIYERLGITVVYVTHSVPEAVFLSNSVMVLSDSPATIKAMIDIEFIGARNQSIKNSDHFHEYLTCVREVLAR